MTEVLHLPPSSSSPNSPSNVLFSSQTGSYTSNPGSNSSGVVERESEEEVLERENEEGERREELKRRQKERAELSFLALLFDVVRKSLIGCSSDGEDQLSSMDIGWPTNVRHVAHVTFDRFNGFLGLPVEFEPDVPRRAPSASTSVFGVSTESMQLSYDSRGNCVPTILILMQRRLYAQGGLQEEGIFRITADNNQEEFVRDQLNRGCIPTDIDVHCLAGLIKAWFRELPTGVLDPLSPEDVMHCESEEDCTQLVRQLPPTEASLLDWAINLMADVVQEEHLNKMNAHNIAMVFAPNMTQMADPLTALMYAVQVMNFLKTLITKRLQDREDSTIDPYSVSCSGPSDESGHQSPPQPYLGNYLSEDTEDSDPEPENCFSDDIPDIDSPMKNQLSHDGDESGDSPVDCRTFKARQKGLVMRSSLMLCPNDEQEQKCGSVGLNRSHNVGTLDKPKRLSNLSRVSSRVEHVEAWC